MTVSRYWTAQAVIDQAAIELGLDAPGSGIYTATDKNAVLLRSLLNSNGQELALTYRWPALVKEHTKTVTNPGDTGKYDLPADFNGMLGGTGWDRTNDSALSIIGGEVWQYRQAVGSAAVTYAELRIVGDQYWTYPAPLANGVVLAFEYLSRYWAKAAGSANPDKATCTVATDVVHFEPALIVSLLKLKFKDARGEDTGSALAEYSHRFNLATSRAVVGADIPLGRSRSGEHLLDDRNIPDTGVGV